MGQAVQSGEEYRALNSRSVRLPGGSTSPAKVGTALLLVLPGALTVYLAFNSGGMFEVTTAFAACVVLIALALGAAVAREPLAGVAPRGLLACGPLGLFALWTLLSARWSHATGRALIAFDRVLLYLAVMALFACVPRSAGRIRWMLRGLLVGSAVVSLAALVSRLLPGLLPTGHGLAEERLSYPITYWNTLALLVGVACILAVHHTCDKREPRSVRVGAAALLPLLGATLLLTFSRGAISVTGLGIVVYVAIARPRGLPGAVLAAAPMTALALSRTYSAQLIQKGTPLTPAAISQAHRLALMLGVCALGAGVLRTLALALDARVERISIPRLGSKRVRLVGVLCAGVVALVAFILAQGPARVHSQYEKFVSETHQSAEAGAGQRVRLLYVGNDGRLPLWHVALDSYRQHPLQGTGAGTYRLQWERHPRVAYDRVYAYSLYVEVLGELGLVGIVLLGASLLTLVVGIAVCVRGPDRAVYAAAFALVIAWVVHTGVDIDWQTPAVSVFVFALGGLALAAPRRRDVPAVTPPPPSRDSPMKALIRASSGWLRPALALAGVAVAVIPAQMAVAQSRLQDSIDALDVDACTRAQASAHGAISASDTGSRPYEVLAMCAARQGDRHAAVDRAEVAVAHDPENWEPHYVLALAQGDAGIDPRHEAGIADQLNPFGQLPREAAAAFRGGDPKRWRATAKALPFSMD